MHLVFRLVLTNKDDLLWEDRDAKAAEGTGAVHGGLVGTGDIISIVCRLGNTFEDFSNRLRA